MIYGTNATFDTPILIETASESLNGAYSRPPAQTPARPSNTRWPRGNFSLHQAFDLSNGDSAERLIFVW